MPDLLKRSRMLLRLEAEISGARTPVEADCKRAERAAYLSRLGRFDEARAELAALRQKYDLAPNINASAWSNLAEGLLAYFSNAGVSRSDRVQRAHALSSAAGNRRLQAICAAWLAQWDYAKLDMDSLALHAAEALRLAGPQHHAARARACLVVAQALHLGARPELAQIWYGRSKDHATADGDDVTISALMHNMAWLRMLAMRQAVLTGKGDLSAGRHALMGAESVSNFDALVGDTSWQELKPILRAQIVSIQGDAAQALTLYEEHLTGARAPMRLQANLLADKAWCHCQLGQWEAARTCAKDAVESMTDETQIDDQAATHSRLGQVFAKLDDVTQRQKHELSAAAAWAAHENLQAKAVLLLRGMNEHGLSEP
jgi:tetratricopeptide (TPR) repeat protein